MKFTFTAAIASLALANLGFAHAVPAAAAGLEDPKAALVKRVAGRVYICPAFDWGVEPTVGCTFAQFTYPYQCIALSEQYYRYTVSAVGPDSGTWCILYQTTNCVNGSPTFTYPGLARLEGTTWGKYNDNTGSIKCWW